MEKLKLPRNMCLTDMTHNNKFSAHLHVLKINKLSLDVILFM